MKYIISESQHSEVIKKYLDSYVRILGPLRLEDFFDGDFLLYVDPEDEWVIAIHKVRGLVEVKSKIWETLQNSFDLTPAETKSHIRSWLIDYTKMDDIPKKISLVR